MTIDANLLAGFHMGLGAGLLIGVAVGIALGWTVRHYTMGNSKPETRNPELAEEPLP